MRIRSFRLRHILLPVLTGTVLLVPVMTRADSTPSTPFLSNPLGIKTTRQNEANPQEAYSTRSHTKKPKNKTDRILKKYPENSFEKSELHLSLFSNAPQQIGKAANDISANNPQAQSMEFQLISHGLRGPNLRLMTADLHRAENHAGSPQEIWRNTEFIREEANDEPQTQTAWPSKPYLWIVQDNQLGWNEEEDSGLLYRASLIAEARAPEIFDVVTLGAAFRLNIADNLDTLDPHTALPVRSDVEDFADSAIGLERLYATSFHTLSPEWHTAFSAGFLEEMVAGAGGEILYRPFKSRFALGAEIWQTFRRDPQEPLNFGLNGDHVLTGHLNAWYDWPDPDVTLSLQAGRYLAEDIGVTAGLEKTFTGGAKLRGFITLTDAEEDRMTQGVSLSLPLGGLPYVPDGSEFRLRAEPFARDSGQSVDKPVSLYTLTEPFTLDHMARHWDEVVE